MANLLKTVVLFFILGLFVSCFDFFEKNYSCPDDSKNLGNNLKFGTYIGENDIVIADETTYTTNRTLRIPVKETLLLYEDSTFTYFAIADNDNNDTIKKVLNGHFKIYQDSGFPWYAIELKSDSIYEKIKIGHTTNNYYYTSDYKTFRYTDFIMSNRSITLAYYKLVDANLISNVDNESGCFSLAIKVNPDKENWCDPDWEYCCDKMILSKIKTLCLQQLEETPEQNSKGDSL